MKNLSYWDQYRERKNAVIGAIQKVNTRRLRLRALRILIGTMKCVKGMAEAHRRAKWEAVRKAQALWSSFKIWFWIKQQLKRCSGLDLDIRSRANVKSVCNMQATLFRPKV
jgi:hypothetical protein